MINAANLHRKADSTRREEEFLSINDERAKMLEKISNFVSGRLSARGVWTSVVNGTDFTPASLMLEIKGDFTSKKLAQLTESIKNYLVLVSKQKVFLTKSENEGKLSFSILDSNVSKKFSPACIEYAEFLKIQIQENYVAQVSDSFDTESVWLVNQNKAKQPFLEFLKKDLSKNLRPLRRRIQFSMSLSLSKGAVSIYSKNPSDKLKIKNFLLTSFVDFCYDMEDENVNSLLVTGKSFVENNPGFKRSIITPYNTPAEKSFYYMGRRVELFKADCIKSKTMIYVREYKNLLAYCAKNKNIFTFLLKEHSSSGEVKIHDLSTEIPSRFLKRRLEIYMAEKIQVTNTRYWISKRYNLIFIKYIDSNQYLILEKNQLSRIKVC